MRRTISLAVVVVVAVPLLPIPVQGFVPPMQTTRWCQQLHEKAQVEVDEEVDDRLSNLDARVLQSMLKNDKLDLGTEQNMKKLLERGVAPKSAPVIPTKEKENEDEDDDGKFSSKVLKTLTDAELWKSLQAKANEVAESAKIYVSNRIERDLKLLASVGLFAWDRVQKDVARALPASGQAATKALNKVLQLGNSSSFDQMQANLSEEEGGGASSGVREGLNTAEDEIKSVSRAIKSILSGESVASVSSSQRGLRTVAPAGQRNSAERQRRALKRRQETTLKREKQPIDIGGIAGSLTDTAWELKREMQAETSRPGYRSEPMRTAIAAGAKETVRAIQQAAEEPDGWKKLLLGEPKNPKPAELTSATTDGIADTVVAEGEEEIELPGYREIIFESANGEVEEAEPVSAEAEVTPTVIESEETLEILDVVGEVEVAEPKVDVLDPEIAVVTETEIETTADGEDIAQMFFSTTASSLETKKVAVQPEIDAPPSEEVKSVIGEEILSEDETDIEAEDIWIPEDTVLMAAKEGDVKVLLPVELVDEKSLFMERLEGCIKTPDSTWLSPEANIPANMEADTVIKAMIVCRDELQSADGEPTSAAALLEDLRRVNARIEALTSLAQEAGGDSVAESLSNQLYGMSVEEEEVLPLLKILDEVEASVERAAAIARDSTSSSDPSVEETSVFEPQPSHIEEQETEIEAREVEAVVVDVDMIPDVAVGKPAEPEVISQDAVVTEVVSDIESNFAKNVEEDNDSFFVAAAEVVSDSDFDRAVGEAKKVESVGEDEMDGEAQEDSALVQVTLRSLDVGFFVTEKVLTVGVPAVVDAGTTATKRIDEVSRGGLGRKGWKRLRNTAGGAKRY